MRKPKLQKTDEKVESKTDEIISNNQEINSKEIYKTLQGNNSQLFGENIEIIGNDIERKEYLKTKINGSLLSTKEKSYYNRILRVLDMPNLNEIEGNPINMVIEKIVKSEFFEGFDIVKTPEIVAEWETFDLFNFAENHVARRPSDSYFINKSNDKRDSILLRPHTSVMRYYYLLQGLGKEKLEEKGEVRALSHGKVYRVDTLDKTHHECFHQIDGLRILSKEKGIIDQSTLKEVLSNTIKTLFGENVKYRFNEDSFPYTLDSLEVEVEYEGNWIEVLGAGVVNPTVLEKLGIDSEKYTGRAFGFGIERLAMALKKIPDIRIFWSDDKRITNQRGNLDPYKEISSFPPVYKDISFVSPKNKFIKDIEKSKYSGVLKLENEIDLFELAGIARDVSGGLIEEIKVVDIYENDEKFGNDNKSVSIKITFRALDKTLTNEEINIVYFKIRERLEKDFQYILR